MLADIAAELLDHHPEAGPTGVLVRVAGRTADLAEHCVGYRQTYRAGDHEQPVRLDQPPALRTDALFDLASVTKVAATTAALMSLTDAGLADPAEPARRWLPELPADGLRLSDLLQHRAGLAEWWPVYLAEQEAPAAAIAALTRRYRRGAGWHYSDLGFILLGLVVERAAGQPLATAVRRLALDPAGMPTADYRPAGVGRTDLPIVATAHGDWYERRMLATGQPYPVDADPGGFTGWRGHTLVGEVHDGNAWHAFGGVAGHAGLFGTADDLVAFGRALLRSYAGEGPWRAGTVRRFFAAGPDPVQGLGFRRWPGHGAVGHSGFTGIRFAVLPERDRVAVLMTNRVHTVRHELLDLSGYWDRVLDVAGGR